MLTLRAPLFVIALLILIVAGAAMAQEANPNPTALQGDVDYTVQVGDTLDSIGAFYDVKVECIAERNELANSARIFPGDVLVLSAACPRYGGFDIVSNPRPDASAAYGLQSAPVGEGQGGGGSGDQVWVVGIGDTLDTIGQALNVSVVALQQANDIEPGQFLQVEQEIVIPADAPAYGLFPALTPVAGSDGQGGGGAAGEVYVVQPRDTLDQIGASLNVQVACVAEANQLDNPNQIFPGQSLLIPASCPAYDGVSTP